MKRFGNSLLFLSLIVTMAGTAAQNPPEIQTLVYREYSNKHEEFHTYRIEKTRDGFRVLLHREGKGIDITDECRTNGEYDTLTWSYRNTATDSEMKGERRGDRILLNGRHEGKPISKTFRIDAAPWKQLFSIDFAPFAAGNGKHSFWTIGTSGPGNMKAARFSAESQGLETIEWENHPLKAIRIRISLGGIKSIFWHGDYWFRESDQCYIHFRGKSIFGRPTVKELVPPGRRNQFSACKRDEKPHRYGQELDPQYQLSPVKSSAPCRSHLPCKRGRRSYRI